MKTLIYHSKIGKEIMIIPEMGTGVIIIHHSISVLPVLRLKEHLSIHKKYFKLVKKVDI